MDPATTALLGVIVVLALNQALLRIPALRASQPAYVFVQGTNAVGGVAVFAFGLPGFEALPVVNWLISLLFLLHGVTNMATWSRDRREERLAEIAEERRAFEAARWEDDGGELTNGADEDPPPDPSPER